MEKVKWYKKLLCGFNPIGDFADWVNRGTDTELPVTKADLKTGRVVTRCWCCTFWRGVLLGLVTGAWLGVAAAAVASVL